MEVKKNMKTKIIGIFVLALLIATGFASAMNVNFNNFDKENLNVNNTLLSETVTFDSTTNDGHIYKTHSEYLFCWMSPSGDVVDTSPLNTVGQAYITEDNLYAILRSFFFFETSSIPDNADIFSASLSIYVFVKTTQGGDYDLIIQNGQPDHPHNPLESGDYFKMHYSGNGGSINTNEIETGRIYIEFDSEDLDWIQKDDITKLCLRSSNDLSQNAPIGDECIGYFSSNYPVNKPKLIVEYTTVPNEPPSNPDINGPIEGKEGKECTFNLMSTDPDGDDVYYWIGWGDGTNTGWKGPYSQGSWREFSHIWEDTGNYEIKAKAKDVNGEESGWSYHNIYIIPLPNLLVYNIYVYPEVFEMGDEVEITGVIMNNGNADATGNTLRMDFEGLSYYYGLPYLGVDEIYLFEIEVSWPMDEEWHLVKVWADYGEDIEESNEDDNYREESFIVSLPDLIVTDIGTVPEKFQPGSEVNIYAKIYNQGTKTAKMNDPQQHFLTSIFLDGEEIGNFGKKELEPEKTTQGSIWCTWPNDRKNHEIKVIVDYMDWIKESNENNNEKTMWKSAPRNTAKTSSVTIKNQPINTPFQWFIQQHPNLFPILRLLLQRLGL